MLGIVEPCKDESEMVLALMGKNITFSSGSIIQESPALNYSFW